MICISATSGIPSIVTIRGRISGELPIHGGCRTSRVGFGVRGVAQAVKYRVEQTPYHPFHPSLLFGRLERERIILTVSCKLGAGNGNHCIHEDKPTWGKYHCVLFTLYMCIIDTKVDSVNPFLVKVENLLVARVFWMGYMRMRGTTQSLSF